MNYSLKRLFRISSSPAPEVVAIKKATDNRNLPGGGSRSRGHSQMPNSLVRKLAGGLLCFIALSGSVVSYAQSHQATLLGQVSDQSGGRVSTYTVMLRNEATNVAVTSAVAQGNDYVLPSIEPGTYELTVVAAGFSKMLMSHIVIDVGQTLRRDVTLNVGGIDSTVNVTSAASLVQTDSSYVGDIIEAKQIEQIPLNGRTNIFGLLALAPGVQSAGGGAYSRIAGSDFTGGTLETFDGVYNMEAENARLSSADPSLDSFSRFLGRVQGSGQYRLCRIRCRYSTGDSLK
jgi:hypothetical protein